MCFPDDTAAVGMELSQLGSEAAALLPGLLLLRGHGLRLGFHGNGGGDHLEGEDPACTLQTAVITVLLQVTTYTMER